MFYDDQAIYIGAVCYDEPGGKGIRAQGLRRDFEFFETDFFGINFDSFLDGKTSLSFQLNPYGALRDIQVFEDLLFERNWNAVWDARTSITDSSWNAEIIIPWKSLRYPSASDEWGINFTRLIRRMNQFTAWSLYPRAFSGYRMDYAGRLKGIHPPPAPLNLDLQPYILASDSRYSDANGYTAEAGVDVKWAVNPFSVVDLTYNTDFAQAEVDNQVINLTRFSVFFPEKRGFFLENEKLFTAGWNNSFYPFFSRKIGLDPAGNPVPVTGGARFVSKSTDRNIGALYIHHEASVNQPASHFGVLRLKEFTGNRSTIGALMTVRSDAATSGAPEGRINATFSADGLFRLSKTFSTEFTLSGSKTWHGQGDGFALYHAISNIESWGALGLVNNVISANYLADAGYQIGSNIIMTYPYAVFNLRPQWKPQYIRSFEPGGFAQLYYEAGSGKLSEGFVSIIPLAVRMQDNSLFESYINYNWQRPKSRFYLSGTVINPGEYDYLRYAFRFTSDQSYFIGASVQYDGGDFYNGAMSHYNIRVRYNPVPHLVFASNWELYQFTRLGMMQENKDVSVIAPELRLSLNPRAHLNLFYQYNSLTKTTALNVRASYEFQPLSYIYFVVNDVTTSMIPAPSAGQKQILLKVSYLLRN
ncbi:MAG: hypothetical protein AMXMBFR48_19130 [Ignavibacteriales bacterium]